SPFKALSSESVRKYSSARKIASSPFLSFGSLMNELYARYPPTSTITASRPMLNGLLYLVQNSGALSTGLCSWVTGVLCFTSAISILIFGNQLQSTQCSMTSGRIIIFYEWVILIYV